MELIDIEKLLNEEVEEVEKLRRLLWHWLQKRRNKNYRERDVRSKFLEW